MNFFAVVQLTIEVRAVKIEGVSIPIIASSDGEDGPEAGEFGDGGKGVKIVHASLLCEPLHYKPGLVLLNRPIGIVLDTKDPFAANNILVGRSGN